MKVDPLQLKNFLLESFLVTKKQLEKAEEEASKSNQKLEDVLIRSGLVKEEEFSRLKAYILGIPFIDLAEEKVSPEVISIIPENEARKENAVAFRQTGNNLEVALLDPENLQIIESLKEKTGLKISPRLTSIVGIQNILSQYPERGPETERAPQRAKDPKEIEKTEEAKQKMSAEKIVEALVKHANLEKISEIRIESEEKDLIIRYCADGAVKETLTLLKNIAPKILARVKTLADLKPENFEIENDSSNQNNEKMVLKIIK